MGKHSFLSASASHRWINCPPSARLCEEYADRPSEYAQEGTDCHELCAYKVEKALGRPQHDVKQQRNAHRGNQQSRFHKKRSFL